jgi:excisionase family DNA binding protein
MINQILLNELDVNELLEKIGQLIDSRILQVQKSSLKNPPKFISRKEVAELLKISLPTLNEWTKLGWLLSYKMGNRVLYKQEEVERAICKVTAYKYKKGGTHGA